MKILLLVMKAALAVTTRSPSPSARGRGGDGGIGRGGGWSSTMRSLVFSVRSKATLEISVRRNMGNLSGLLRGISLALLPHLLMLWLLKALSLLHLPQSLLVMRILSLLKMAHGDHALPCGVHIYPLFVLDTRRKEIGRGFIDGRLFYLCTGHPVSSKAALTSSSSAIDWHVRLGHPNPNKLKLLVPCLRQVSTLVWVLSIIQA